MIRVSLLCLAYFSIVMAVDDVTMIPVCEKKSPNDIYFDLSNMGLGSIRKSFVSGPSVTCVNLAGNRIAQIEKGVFDNLPDLIYLNLARNPISFEDFMKMTFPTLRALVLDGPFEDREEHDPSSCYYQCTSSNKEINRRLDSIHPILLPSLEKLSLSNNKDKPVRTWLDYFIVPNLTYLNIAKNSFINGNLLQNITENLTHLNMDDNRVSRFATYSPKLRHLSMDRNRIENVCNQNCAGNFLSLRHMPKLEYLSLAGNKINTIERGAFHDLINLHFLNLAMNEISYLPRHLFDNLPILKNLSLAQNKLMEIPDLCGLIQLEVLILKGTKTNNVDDTIFCNLTHLSSIDLSHNGWMSVSDGTFGQLPGLRMLDLSWNNITALPESWIRSGHVLDVLNLDGNLFEDTANMSLGLIKRLEILSIGQNPLKRVTISSLATLAPNMKIDVSRVYKYN